jgi:spermidine/putrescine transport system substrate-binding protein
MRMAGRTPSRPAPGTGGRMAAWMQALEEGRITRRQLVARATALGLSAGTVGAFLAACGGGSSKAGAGGGASSFPTTKPASIAVHNWAAYISPKSIKRFESETGIKVDYSLFDSNEQLVAQMQAGKVYDVVFPEEWAAEVLIKAGKLQPLDTDLLPNLANVTDPTFRNPPYDPGTGGKKYTTVYMFGTEGFAVRIDKVPDPPESWEPLYETKYRQQLSMLDGTREVLGPALFMVGSDPNCTDQATLDRATAKAIEQKALVTVYNSSTQVSRMRDGLAFVECWDGDAIQAMNKIGVSKIRYILPKEGYSVWADAPAVPANAPSPYGAHLFLDFLMRPEVAAECASFIGYEPVITAADPLIASMVQRAMRPTAEQIAGGTMPRDLGDFTSAYTKAYAKVLAS